MADLPRVLLLTDADVFAGTERHILDLAEALRALSVPVQIGCPEPSPLAQLAGGLGIAVTAIQKRGSVDFAAIRILTRMLRAGQIDIVHAHNGRTHLAAALAVGRARRGACIATQHFLSPSRTSRKGVTAWISRMAHRRVAARTARFIAISQAVKSKAVKRESDLEPRIDVVLNGMRPPDGERLKPVGEIRQSLGISAATPMVFCAARLQNEKDIPTLIAAMKQVAAQIPTARCFIAGEGDEKTALEAMIREHGLSDHVSLLGFRSDIADLMNAAEVFALPSLAEPFGLVLLEAMSLGKPVIATRAGGPCEIVEHGVTGLLANPRDPEDFGHAIIALLADSEMCARFGEAGRNRFLQHFTSKRMATETLGVYAAAMEQTKR